MFSFICTSPIHKEAVGSLAVMFFHEVKKKKGKIVREDGKQGGRERGREKDGKGTKGREGEGGRKI